MRRVLRVCIGACCCPPRRNINPGLEEEEAMIAAPSFRRCANSKSRKNPDVQCPLSATHGDYCHMHYKKPRPFRVRNVTETDALAALLPSKGGDSAPASAARKIQAAWRAAAPLLRFSSQGPAANDIRLATNDTELYTLDPTHKIQSLYLFSFADSHKTVWAFDIRTLSHSMATGFPQQNPYTREGLPAAVLARLHRRIEWLRARKYQILHIEKDELTPEQAWNQRVLDVFLKIEALGYYVSNRWFHELTVPQHKAYYIRLYELWEWRLGLTPTQKEAVVPGHLAAGPARLFRFPPDSLPSKERVWWERTTLGLIEAFITRAVDRENRKLGALYVLMGLVQVSREAARGLPWVVEAAGANLL